MREFDANGDIKSNTLAGPPSGAAGGELTGTYPNPTVISSGLVVKVPNTFADGQLRRNHADDAWACLADLIVESAGPTPLVVGAVADGEYLVRSGTTVVGGPGGSGSSTNASIAIYGDGSDGDADLDGANTYASFLSKASAVYTLLRDVYFNNLTVRAGSKLKTSGFRYFVKNTRTIEATGIISADGEAGLPGVADVGGDQASQHNVGTMEIGNTAGANGEAGTTAGGTQAGNGTIATGEGGNGGAGGAGGAGTAGDGGEASGSATNIFAPVRHLLTLHASHSGEGGSGGSSGSSGAGNGVAVKGGGGGGGAAGGDICCGFARISVNAGTIRANGGAGGAGGNGGATILATGGGGGAGGGGGGFVYDVTDSSTGAGTWTAAGGGGGAGGIKGAGGTGTDGAAGSAGGAGHVVKINRLTGVITVS